MVPLLGLAALTAAGLGAREVLQPAAISVEEFTINVEPGQSRELHVVTSGGLPFASALRWVISPSSLGTIDGRGVFRAGVVTGEGTLTGEFGSARREIAVTVACPKHAELSGVRFSVSCGRYSDVYVDLTAAAEAYDARVVADSLAQRVARDLDLLLSLQRKFRVYYFGSTNAYVAGVSELGRTFVSGPTALESTGMYLADGDVIVIDRSQYSDDAVGNVLAHELVHRFIRQFVGANIDSIPAWLNEGWATVEEMSMGGWLRTEALYVSASMAHAGLLPSLATLTYQDDWNSRTGLDGLYQYYAASQAVQFLIADIKVRGVVEILKRVRDGDTFDTALARVKGFEYGVFRNRLSDRVAAQVASYPGLATSAGSPGGSTKGSTIIGYGFMPNALVKLTLDGPTHREAELNVDPYGVVVRYLSPDLPAGRYTVLLEGDGRRFTGSATN